MYKAFIRINSESPYHLPGSEKGPRGWQGFHECLSVFARISAISLCSGLLWAIWRQLAFLTPPAHYTHMHTLRDHDSLLPPLWSSAAALRPSWEWGTFSTALRTPSSYPWGLGILLLRGWDCCLTSWTLWALILFSLTSENKGPLSVPWSKKLYMPPDKKPWGSTILSSWWTNYPPTLHLKQ